MSDTQTLLLQKAVFAESKDSNNTEIDLSLLRDCAFVETIDLSGPRLIMKYDDRFSILRNVMGLTIGSVINCILSTAAYDGSSGEALNVQADFTVMSMPVEGDLVTVNLLQKEVANLKIPQKSSLLYSLEGTNPPTVETIIKELLPESSGGITGYLIDDVATLNSYHLLPGERPSHLLRRLALEHGLNIFIRRNVVYCQDLTKLYATPSNITFCYKDPAADHQIVTYRHLNADNLVSDRIIRKYIGFSLTDGLIQSTKYLDCPMEWSRYDNTATLDNLTKITMPILDIITFGTGRLAPGMSIDFQWNLDYPYNDSVTDESLPKHAVIGNVSHYTSGAMNYYCRIKAVVPHEQ